MKSLIYKWSTVLLLFSSSIFAQETINAYDPNSFIFGGDQKSVVASIELQPFGIIDIEPEGELIGSIAGGDMEAGLAVVAGGGLPENLWINFSFRAANYQPARIYVSTNQPVPAGMTIKVEIIETGVDGSFPKNPVYGQLILSQTEQRIVHDFANGYTGDGVNKGYKLKYTLENPGSASLPSGFQIIYRIG